jgi:hypothetical protein
MEFFFNLRGSVLLLWTFYCEKIKLMLQSMKIQNGAQIQDGRPNFLLFKTCKFEFFVKFL